MDRKELLLKQQFVEGPGNDCWLENYGMPRKYKQ
jgi:hypothetical protein